MTLRKYIYIIFEIESTNMETIESFLSFFFIVPTIESPSKKATRIVTSSRSGAPGTRPSDPTLLPHDVSHDVSRRGPDLHISEVALIEAEHGGP